MIHGIHISVLRTCNVLLQSKDIFISIFIRCNAHVLQRKRYSQSDVVKKSEIENCKQQLQKWKKNEKTYGRHKSTYANRENQLNLKNVDK